MEQQPVRPAEPSTPEPLEFKVGAYKVRCSLGREKIFVTAYLEFSKEVFSGIVEESSLKRHEKQYFGNLRSVYSMM